MQKLLIPIIVSTLLVLNACNKKQAEPSATNTQGAGQPVTPTSFTLTANDLNFPIGTTWVYEYKTEYQHIDFINSSGTYSTSSVEGYTVVIIGDTIVKGLYPGKKLVHNWQTQGFGDFRNECYYVDGNNQWQQVLTKRVAWALPWDTTGITVQLPLLINNEWKNQYNDIYTVGIDSIKSINYEIVNATGQNYSCVKIKNNAGVEEVQQTIWINNVVGKVCSIKEQNYSDVASSNLNRYTLKLISFHL